MATTLEQDNYVKIFASHLFKKFPDMTRDTRQEWVSEIVDGLGDLYDDPSNRLGIHSIDIAPMGDLIVAYRQADEAIRLVDDGRLDLTLRRGVRCIIPTAPVVE
jgi:hypothetical protein